MRMSSRNEILQREKKQNKNDERNRISGEESGWRKRRMAVEGRGRIRGESMSVTQEGRERVKSILIPLIPMLFFPLVYKHTCAG